VKEAEQRFLLRFLEKEEYHEISECYQVNSFLGASPQTPWVGFAELWVSSYYQAQPPLTVSKGHMCGIVWGAGPEKLMWICCSIAEAGN
jgi:hypothetical protein